MARVGKALAGPLLVTNSVVTRYTVPANTRAEIRKIHISNNGAATTLTISKGADAAGTRILDAYPVAANAQFDLWGPYWMETGEILQTNAADTNRINIEIDGFEYTAG